MNYLLGLFLYVSVVALSLLAYCVGYRDGNESN